MEHQKKVRRSARSVRGSIRFHIFAIAFGIIMIYPLLWMFSSSLKPNEEVFTTVSDLIPSRIVWQNYIDGWNNNGSKITYATYFKNSLTISIWAMIGGVISSSLAAYGFARIPFKGHKLLFTIMMGTMLLPAQVLQIPQYLLFRKLNWVDTFLPMIVPQFCGVPFFIFLNMQFMRGVPKELDEAAEMDGCGWWGKYFRVMVPLAVPSMVTSAIFAFYWSWQEFQAPLIYLNSEKMYPLSLALRSFSDPTTNTPYANLFAMTTLSILPVIVVYMFFQKYLVEGVATTGLKG